MWYVVSFWPVYLYLASTQNHSSRHLAVITSSTPSCLLSKVSSTHLLSTSALRLADSLAKPTGTVYILLFKRGEETLSNKQQTKVPSPGQLVSVAVVLYLILCSCLPVAFCFCLTVLFFILLFFCSLIPLFVLSFPFPLSLTSLLFIYQSRIPGPIISILCWPRTSWCVDSHPIKLTTRLTIKTRYPSFSLRRSLAMSTMPFEVPSMLDGSTAVLPSMSVAGSMAPGPPPTTAPLSLHAQPQLDHIDHREHHPVLSSDRSSSLPSSDSPPQASPYASSQGQAVTTSPSEPSPATSADSQSSNGILMAAVPTACLGCVSMLPAPCRIQIRQTHRNSRTNSSAS